MTKIEELEQKLIILNKMHTKAKEDFESISNELNECQKALAELKESKKEGKWKPTYNEMYIYRADFGGIRSCYWADSEIDEWRYNNMPIFKTNDEYKKYWHFMDTVKEKSYEFSKEELVDTNIEKWYIGLKHGGLCVDFVYGVGLLGATYFKTEEDAQYIIDNFKDELMEYWI